MKLIWSIPAPLRETIQRFFESNDETDAVDPEDSVGLLNGNEKHHTPPSRLQRDLLNSRNRKAWLYLAFFGIILIFIALAAPTRRVARVELPFMPATAAARPRQEDRFLHIVISQAWSSEASVELCKTVLTASTLGYPTPWSANWNSTLDAEGRDVNTTLNKLEHISTWLSSMPEDRGDDVVVILSNNKSWFQVRPEVLLKRYFAILETGNKELGHHVSADVRDLRDVGEKVVFATQKRCPSKHEASCQGQEAGDKSVHYLSANFAMGSMKDLKTLWQHAAIRATELTARNATLDDHSVFVSLLADQQQYRHTIREQKNHAEDLPAQDEFQDFGIHLDLKNELSYTAALNTDDIEWIKYHNPTKPETRKWISPPDLYLPVDISISAPPLWTIDGTSTPLHNTWHDVQLLTSTSSNTIPAIIQRGHTSRPTLSTTWWEKMWFHPYGRRLLDTFVLT
ncbi:hypothetical protein DOTSEDRAFT_74502, partial [Dothistroma septosporum NZE10]